MSRRPLADEESDYRQHHEPPKVLTRHEADAGRPSAPSREGGNMGDALFETPEEPVKVCATGPVVVDGTLDRNHI